MGEGAAMGKKPETVNDLLHRFEERQRLNAEAVKKAKGQQQKRKPPQPVKVEYPRAGYL